MMKFISLLKIIKNNLDIFFSKNFIPNIIFIQYFKFLFKFKNKRKITMSIKKSLFEIRDNIDEKFFYWHFPTTLKYRGLIRYTNNTEWMGKSLAKDYHIDKIKFDNGDIIIDCGANFGDLAIYLHCLKLNFNYYGFEPGNLEFEALTNNLKNINFKSKLINKALGENDENKTLYYSPEGGDSSLIKPQNFSNSFLVEVLKLDSFISQENLNNKKIKLLKLEAEGSEPEILLGAKNLLKNVEYIAADLGPERGLNEENTVAKVTEILQDSGFTMKYFSHIYKALFINNNP